MIFWLTIEKCIAGDFKVGENIFKANETGMFFKCLPNQTLVFKGHKCLDGKHSTEQITCFFASTMSGMEKLKPLITSKPLNHKRIKNGFH